MHKILLKIGKLRLFAELTEESPAVAKIVWEKLPIQGEAKKWGEEIYFFVGFDISQKGDRQDCDPGEIGFWSEGPGIAIFFGKTPASTGGKPRAYSPCNFFAKTVGSIDKDALNAVKEGEKILIEKAKQA